MLIQGSRPRNFGVEARVSAADALAKFIGSSCGIGRGQALIVSNSLHPERRALRTALSPTECAARLGAVTAHPLIPWVQRTFSGRVSSERFNLTEVGSRSLVKAVARGQIGTDGEGTLLRFELGPDLPLIVVTMLAVVLFATYVALSIYRIPLFGHVLPAIPVRPGSSQIQLRLSPFLAVGGALLIFLIERPFVRRRKINLMRQIIRVINGRVVSPDELPDSGVLGDVAGEERRAS